MSLGSWLPKFKFYLALISEDSDTSISFSSLQLLSHVPTVCDPMDCSPPGFPVLHPLMELAQTHVNWVSSAIQPQPSYPLIRFSFCLQSFPALWVRSNESVLHIGWPNNGASFSASVLPMNIQDWFSLGLTGLISLRVQDSQKSSWTPQLKSINCLALSFLYGPPLTSICEIGKIKALAIWTFVRKVMSLLFNILSRLVIPFLQRSKCLLISWLQSLSVVILEPKKIKSVTVSIILPSIYHEVMGLDAMISGFLNVEF